MGQVAVKLKVMPKTTDVNMDEMKNKIKNLDINIKDMKTEDLAFGLKTIKLLIVLPDRGGTDEIENRIREIEEVGEVETEDITLL
ncbi:MAG: elongation factor 1-beta [Candidatus Aenigmarchaeota archaeon]|nr:elongation factor 1-beta [Candidatus Aenigmarchaeota archaeon]